MTTRSNRLAVPLAGVVALVFSLVHARAAAAEPTAADVETARALYVEGLELRDRGDVETSLERFRAAHALAATPITSLELGRAMSLVGQLVEARELLLLVDRMPPNPSESAKATHARTEARTLAEQIRPRIPTLVVGFSPSPPRPPRVLVDGVPVPQEALASPRRVNPGRHIVYAELGGARASQDVLLLEGESKNVTLRLEGSLGAAPAPPAPASSADAGVGAWFYVGVAVAGVGVATGTITGAIALSKASTLEAECFGTRCPRSAQSDLDTSRTMGTISTVAFVIGGLGGALAVVGWLTSPSEHARTTDSSLRLTW
jgi:hypothetical protein